MISRNLRRGTKLRFTGESVTGRMADWAKTVLEVGGIYTFDAVYEPDPRPPAPFAIKLIEAPAMIFSSAMFVLAGVESLEQPPETFESIGDWVGDTFPGADPNLPRVAIRAFEECIEFCLEAGASGQELMHVLGKEIARSQGKGEDRSMTGRRGTDEAIAKELADSIIAHAGAARTYGIKLGKAVDKAMRINRGRKWRPGGDGTGPHIKEGS